MESVINDVELLDLAVIPTDGGPVMHMMRPASPLFGEIGEVYFSEVEPGCVKAWKCAPDAAFCRACGAAEDCPV